VDYLAIRAIAARASSIGDRLVHKPYRLHGFVELVNPPVWATEEKGRRGVNSALLPEFHVGEHPPFCRLDLRLR
jgi:hypothetical protein